MTKLITSADNPLAKRVRALSTRKARRDQGVFLVEGMQPVWRAAESGWKIDTLILAPDLVQNPAAFEMASDLEQRGSSIARLSSDLFSRLSERDGPAGVMAIVESRHLDLRNLTVLPDDVWIVLNRVHNPGNLGTILRTADAAGCTGVILAGDCTDPFAPSAVKASMGSVFSVKFAIEQSLDAVIDWARAHHMRLVGTSGYAELAHWDADWSGPIAIVLGNEGDGLPHDVLKKMNSAVRIPMTGTAESLNLGVAAALLIYEAKRHQLD